jgi:hypothetical protein
MLRAIGSVISVLLLHTAIFRILSVLMLSDKYILQNAFSTTVGLRKLLPSMKTPSDITERRGATTVAPAELSVTIVLLALIVMWIVYSVLGWWTWA